MIENEDKSSSNSDSSEQVPAPEQSTATTDLAEASAPTRAGATQFSPKTAVPLGNPRLSVGS